jgi:GAF domain-containing protein
MIDHTRLHEELTRFARLLVQEYSVSDALHDLVEVATGVLDVVGAGVSLARDGRLRFATASPGGVAALEHLQERTQTGPSVEAFEAEQVVTVGDLCTEHHRWPSLAASAQQADVHAMAGVPMVLNGTKLGVLNLYDARPRSWTDEEREVAGLLAAVATGYVANAARLHEARHTAEQLQEALDSRVIIEQAKGVLAAERNVSVDEAFRILRHHARNRNGSLREVAHAVVHLRLRP